MSSTPGPHETLDGIDVEAVDSVDGPWLRSTAAAGARLNGGRLRGYHPRVRVAALTAEVEALEAEVDALEQIVEAKEEQRQQVIDNYETIVAARSEADSEPATESAASGETGRWRPVSAVASSLERAAAWLRRANE